MSAAAAMSATVVRSKPRSANRSMAASTIASRVWRFLRSRRPGATTHRRVEAIFTERKYAQIAFLRRVSDYGGMTLVLARLARGAAAHWKRSLALVAVVLVALGAAAGLAGGSFTDDFRTPGTESQAAVDLLEE